MTTVEASTTYWADYNELLAKIKEKHFLDKNPYDYTAKFIVTGLLWFISGVFLFTVDTLWVQLVVNAAFLAPLAYVQTGFLGHHAGHRGLFRSVRNNERMGLAVNFLLSLSRSWWMDDHGLHHKNPNNLMVDPHTCVPNVAFSAKEALKKTRFWAFVGRHQDIYYWLLLLLEGFGIRRAGFAFLFGSRKAKYPVLEPVLMIGHFIAYFALLSLAFGASFSILWFFLVHQVFFGLFFGLVFVPNHKGMLIIDKDNKDEYDYFRMQVLTTRNVKSNFRTRFMYGGLEDQIGHHLFPSMSPCNARKAREIIKAFCQEKDVTYHETSTIESWGETYRSLREAGRPNRAAISMAND